MEVKSMRQSFETVFGELDEKLCPGKYSLGTKIEELVENEPLVEDLTEVTNKEDGEEDLWIPDLTKEGVLKMKKGQCRKSPTPNNSEEYRKRLKVLNNGWLFARTRHMRSWVEDLQENTYGILADYILGELCCVQK